MNDQDKQICEALQTIILTSFQDGNIEFGLETVSLYNSYIESTTVRIGLSQSNKPPTNLVAFPNAPTC